MKLNLRRPVVLSSGRPFTCTGTHRHCHVASATWQLVKLTFPCLGDNCGHWHPTIVNDLLSGQFNDPVRIVAFNTLEHWAEDVSGNGEIKARCDIQRRFPFSTTGWILRGRHGSCPAASLMPCRDPSRRLVASKLLIPASSNLPWRHSPWRRH
jgi:hypothetical protein